MRRFQILVLTATLLISSILLSGSADSTKRNQRESYLIRTELAGVKLNIAQKDFLWFDPASKYYLAKTGSDWEHASATLILTPDQKSIPFLKVLKLRTKVRHVKLPRLKNGRGINIGDSIAVVHRKLGEEPEYHYTENKGRKRTEVYFGSFKMQKPQRGGGSKLKTFFYRATYTFLDGKLRTIEYSAQTPDRRV